MFCAILNILIIQIFFITGMPTLLVRKRRALEQELDTSLSETCENIESPERWDSHESITSTHSENIFDRTTRIHCHRSGSLQVSASLCLFL